MVELSVIINLLIAGIVCFLVPVGGIVLLSKYSKYTIGPFVAGMISFFVMQLIIRIPLLQVLNGMITIKESWSFVIPYALFLGFTAALFETVGRVASIHWLVHKEKRNYFSGLAHGFGHGGIEAVMLVGINYIAYMVMGIVANRSGFQAGLFKNFGEIEMSVIEQILMYTKPSLFLLAGFERVLAICFHVAMSLMIMEGFIHKRLLSRFILVIALHTTLDAAVVILSFAGLGVLWIEVFLLVFAVGCIIYSILMKGSDISQIKLVDSGEQAVEEGY